MSFAQDNGYTPKSIQILLDSVREEINTRFNTAYTAENFVGTNWYKFIYAVLQKVQENEVKTSEIFQKLQEYIAVTNEAIARPSVSDPGLLDAFDDAGYIASVKPPEVGDAGKIYICIDALDNHARGLVTISSYANLVSGTDDSITVGGTVFTAQAGAATPGATTFQAATSNTATALSLATQINAHATAGALVYAWAIGALVYVRAILGGTAGNSIALVYTDHDTNVGASVSAATLLGGIVSTGDDYDDVRLEICNLIKTFIAAGIVSQGTEIENIALSNGQNFDFKFNLPERIPTIFRITITESDNNLIAVPSDEDVRQAVFDNVNAAYRLGLDFEPQRYFNAGHAPYAAVVLFEWSINGGSNWFSTVRDGDYDELLTFDLEDIEVVFS